MSSFCEILIEIRDVLFDLPAFLTAPLYRRHHLRWGATTAETDGDLPGDKIFPKAQFIATQRSRSTHHPKASGHGSSKWAVGELAGTATISSTISVVRAPENSFRVFKRSNSVNGCRCPRSGNPMNETPFEWTRSEPIIGSFGPSPTPPGSGTSLQPLGAPPRGNAHPCRLRLASPPHGHPGGPSHGVRRLSDD